jgi:DNA-binding CsgD family transcriptional regulator
VVVTSAARSRSRDRIRRIAVAGLDAESLRGELIIELRRTIGFDAWCWPLVDPGTNLPTTGMGDIPHWAGLPKVMDLRESAADEFAQLRRDQERAGQHVGVLSQVMRGDLARSAEWREVVGPAGLGDEMRVAFVDAGRPWAQLHLFRDGQDQPFGHDEVQFMREIDQPVASALRQASVQPRQADQLDDIPVGVLIIDRSLQATTQTPATNRWLQLLQPTSVAYGHPITASLFQLAARVRRQSQLPGTGQPSLACRARLRTRDGRWVLVEGQPLDDPASSVVLTLRQAALREVFDLVCLGYGLSPREAEVTALLVQGVDTAGIARRLYVTEHTVYDHVKAVLAKTGVRSRRELVATIA